jgi:hypothetical protein
MLVQVQLRLEAYHKPTETWHNYQTTQGVRAVSTRHALAKGLQRVMAWPGYTDREGHQDWQVSAEARLDKS